MSNIIIPTESSKTFEYGGARLITAKSSYDYVNLLIPDTYTIPTYQKRYLYNITAVWDDTTKYLPFTSISYSYNRVYFIGKVNGSNYDILCATYPTGDLVYVSIDQSNFDNTTNKLTAFGISAYVSATTYGSWPDINCNTKTLQEMQDAIRARTASMGTNQAFTRGTYYSGVYAVTADTINSLYG